MRHYSFQELICIVLIIVYLIGIIIDIYKKQYKNVNFIISIIFFLLTTTITFITAPAFVVGSSMEPTLHNKDVLAINKLDRDFNTNDIVVFRSKTLKKSLIKRIVAVEGDTVSMKDGCLYINGVLIKENYETIPTVESFDEVTVPIGCYFVMGDNRPGSLDSRSTNVGFIEKNYIYGKIIR